MKSEKPFLSSTRKLDSGLALFLKEIATNPKAMGAAWPSSKRLARRIAKQVPLNPGYVVELGPGTGVVTQALLEHGISTEQLLLIERSIPLVSHLNQRFPAVKIIEGDAAHLSSLLGDLTQPVNTIVSGLPLRSLPPEMVQAIGLEIEKVLAPGGLYIHFTYSLHRQPLPPSPHLCCVHSEFILLNFPSARVDVFRYAG